MSEQKGRDGEEVVRRRDGMTNRDSDAAPKLRTGADSESADFDETDDQVLGTRDPAMGAAIPDPKVGSGMANPADMGDQG